MSTAIEKTDRKAIPIAATTPGIQDLILLRVVTGGATRADLQREVAPLLARKLSGTEFRRAAELALSRLVGAQLITDSKGRLTATTAGSQVAQAIVAPSHKPATWDEAKSALVLRALTASDTPSIRKALQRTEGLAALVLQHHFGKSTARVLSPADLRAELAIISLERAFGNKIKTGLGKGAGLPAKPGRLLACQLFKQPREIATDGKLILQLACEVTGSRDASREALELALLRKFLADDEVGHALNARTQVAEVRHRPARTPVPNAANDRAPLAKSLPPRSEAARPPDMTEFCHAVIDAARPVSEGWPGNRKAFISLVWKAIRNARPDWGLSEVAFKAMLAEAHRSGQVELASADLKDGRDLKSLEDSKILYKNTVWHFVRVQD